MIISQAEFIDLLSKISKAKSVSGSLYYNIKVEDGWIIGNRKSSGTKFKILILKLYEAYSQLTSFTTGTLKPYVKNEASPALAILMEIGLIKNGYKVSEDSSLIFSTSNREVLPSLSEIIRQSLEKNPNNTLKEYYERKYCENESSTKINNHTKNEMKTSYDKSVTNDENNDSDKKIQIGCAFVIFIFLICGIPAAVKGEGPIGSIVITIGSLAIAYYISKALANLD